MTIARRRRSGALVAAALALVACGDSGPSRTDVVGAITGTPVPERYAEFSAIADEVRPAVEGWCEAADAAESSEAVAGARRAWVELAPFWFGPSNDRRSMFIIDPTPREADIDELVASDQPVDALALRELAGADQRGLGSLDHVLASPPSERSCEYALGLADLVAEEAAGLADDWVAYGPELAVDDESANVALRNIVSDSLFSMQMAPDEPSDDLVGARIDGVRWALLGGAEHDGITELLSDETVEQLASELDAGDAEAAEITISTNVVGELGTTVNFSDADGDG